MLVFVMKIVCKSFELGSAPSGYKICLDCTTIHTHRWELTHKPQPADGERTIMDGSICECGDASDRFKSAATPQTVSKQKQAIRKQTEGLRLHGNI